MRRAALVGLLALAACAPAGGGAPTGSPTAASAAATSPTPSAVPTAPPAIAVVLGQLGNVSQQPQISHVVAIGLDGKTLAEADFQPPPNVDVGPAAVVYPPPIRVAGGRVYFIDGSGYVRRLTHGGADLVSQVPVPTGGTQFMLSFGVAPDGRRVVASVTRFGAAAGSDIYRADAGQPAQLLGHIPAPAGVPASAVLIEGFDGDAVVAEVDGYAAVQNDPNPPGHEFMSGRLVQLTAQGGIGNSYAGADCKPFRWFGSLTVCAQQLNPDGMTGVSVRRGDGTTVLSAARVAGCAVPSADGRRLAAQGELITAGAAAPAPLPIDACPLAWVDAAHLVASGGDLHGSSPAEPFVLTIVDSTRVALGQKGQFEGLASSL